MPLLQTTRICDDVKVIQSRGIHSIFMGEHAVELEMDPSAYTSTKQALICTLHRNNNMLCHTLRPAPESRDRAGRNRNKAVVVFWE
jgi:hypothetical protein